MPQLSSTPGRRIRVAVAAVAAMALAAAPAALADAPIRWKFTKGETIRYTLVQKTQTKVKAGPNEAGPSIDQTSYIRWNIDDVSPEGVAQMTQVNERIKIKMEGAPGQPPFEFDSADENKAQEGPVAAQLGPIFKALSRLEYTFKMDPLGRIDAVRIPQKSLDNLKGSFSGPMSELFSEESMKKMITQSILVFPEDAKTQWNEKSTLPVPQFGTIVTDKNYAIAAPGADAPGSVKKISLDASMKIEPSENSQLKLEIKEQKNEGTYSFDADKGRLLGSHITVKMVQLITAGERQFQQTVDNTMDMTLTPESAPK